MAKEIFEALEGQQDMFGSSQATKIGDTIYVAGTVDIGKGPRIPESMAEQSTGACLPERGREGR